MSNTHPICWDTSFWSPPRVHHWVPKEHTKHDAIGFYPQLPWIYDIYQLINSSLTLTDTKYITFTIPCIPISPLENMSLHRKCAPAVMRSVEPGKAAGDNHCEADDDGEDSTNCTIRSGLTFLGVPHLSSSDNLGVSPPKGTISYIYMCVFIQYTVHRCTQCIYIVHSMYIYILILYTCVVHIYIYVYIRFIWFMYIYILYVSMYPGYQLKMIRIESEWSIMNPDVLSSEFRCLAVAQNHLLKWLNFVLPSPVHMKHLGGCTCLGPKNGGVLY